MKRRKQKAHIACKPKESLELSLAARHSIEVVARHLGKSQPVESRD